MGRLQNYLRRLPAEAWEALSRAAEEELGPKTRALLVRLRQTGVPQVLSGSEKELAQRAERWIWRRTWLLEHSRHPLRAPARPEWVLTGATLYYQAGLEDEALALLERLPPEPWDRLRFLFQRLRWQIAEGKFRQSVSTLRVLQSELQELQQSLEIQRLELLFHRLLREHGGSYTRAAQRLLARLARHPRWQAPLPTPPAQAAREANLRALYAIARADLGEALQWYEHLPAEAIPARLNAWLVHLMAHSPIESLVSLWAGLSPPLPPQHQAVLLNRVLLTLLRYAPPSFLPAYREALEQRLCRQSLYTYENGLTWAQLLYLSGATPKALEEIQQLLQARLSPFLRLQGQLLLTVLYTEAQSWTPLIRLVPAFLRWLKQLEPKIASAPLLRKLIRQLYQNRLQNKVQNRSAQAWNEHLEKYPTEALLWRLTLLPDWIEAKKAGLSLYLYRAKQLRADPATLHAMMEKLFQLLP